ncbi:cyclase family protein [Methanolobus sp. WCC5]|uniref:cyclase family protein n=1 Tax=Methanolobus sp. WCC5 TaxID=3125785 RepID=UPI00324E3E65
MKLSTFSIPGMFTKLIDISTGISADTPVYEGDPAPLIEKVSSIGKDGFVVSRISIGTHTGTHVDAPAHIIAGGKCVDELDPLSFMGKAMLLDLSKGEGRITADELDEYYIKNPDKEDVDILLLKTDNEPSPHSLLKSQRLLAASAGNWVLEHGFRLVGVDTLSVDADSSLPNHHLFLRNGLNIVELLNLSHVEAGTYIFICLPLKLIGCDASPARAILIQRSSII